MTEILTNKAKHSVPTGCVVPSAGWLMVWADNETSQNEPLNPELHVHFSLNALGRRSACLPRMAR